MPDVQVILQTDADIAPEHHGGGCDIKLIFSCGGTGPHKAPFSQYFVGGVHKEQQIVHSGGDASHHACNELKVNGSFQHPFFHKVSNVINHTYLVYLKLRFRAIFSHNADIVLDVLEGVGERHPIGVLYKGNLPIELWLFDFVRDWGEAEIDRSGIAGGQLGFTVRNGCQALLAGHADSTASGNADDDIASGANSLANLQHESRVSGGLACLGVPGVDMNDCRSGVVGGYRFVNNLFGSNGQILGHAGNVYCSGDRSSNNDLFAHVSFLLMT
ncbi:hypothetical protein SDC9_84511 [bioreactor metagenome]|uniref:Uncharacterized protein n=1 Tax=bioreactor metagenome TaxID=1076179 RepID=A0A644ZDB9_9ZZZZ